MEKPKILISSCILGNKVRYDGSGKLDVWITTKLSEHFDFIPICPEVMMGMSTPREPVNLQLSKSGEIKMLGIKSKTDHTDSAIKTSQEIINTKLDGVCGVILQKKSPSCGVERVRLYNEKNVEIYTMKNTSLNRGIFASMLIEQNSQLPIIDSGRFFDQDERKNFLRRVICYFRYSKLDGSINSLQDFHSRYKFIIMEHSKESMYILGKIAGNRENIDSKEVYNEYSKVLFDTLSKIPTRESRANVFLHLAGFFKKELPKNEKSIIKQMITDYSENLLPYFVPLKMIEFLIGKYKHPYLSNHYILNQYPKELNA